MVFSDRVSIDNDPNANVGSLTIVLILDEIKIVELGSRTLSSSTSVGQSNIVFQQDLVMPIVGNYQYMTATKQVVGTVDSRGRKVVAMITCDEVCMQYEYDHVR